MSGELAEQDGITPLTDGEGPDKPTGKLGRRALMLGAATGVGAAAAVVAGASPAGAANGDPVAQGQVNTCSATTEVSTSAGSGLLGTINEDQTGLLGGQAAGVVGDVNGTSGVIGLSGVHDGVYGASHALSGITGLTAGVLGESDSNDGVTGLSSSQNGVHGISHQPFGGNLGVTAGVMGESDTNDGVVGVTAGVGAVGVLGYDISSGSESFGVYGFSQNGTGVIGTNFASGQCGVVGLDQSGGNGIGVTAQSAHGTALKVEGVTTFTRSGVTTLTTAGTSVLTVAVAGGLKTTSHVLATIQTNTGTISVRAAVPNTSTGKITIYFTGSAPVGTKVAWFVFG